MEYCSLYETFILKNYRLVNIMNFSGLWTRHEQIEQDMLIQAYSTEHVKNIYGKDKTAFTCE